MEDLKVYFSDKVTHAGISLYVYLYHHFQLPIICVWACISPFIYIKCIADNNVTD